MKRVCVALKLSNSRRWLPAVGLSAASLLWLQCGVEEAAEVPTASTGQAIGDRPAACDRSHFQLVGGDIALLAACPSDRPPGQALSMGGRHVLFVNFEGVDIRGGDTALENEGLRQDAPPPAASLPPVIQMEQYAPTDGNRYDTILKIQKKVAGWYSDMNLDVVISRPLSGDYMMTVVGDHETKIGLGPPVVGISPGDCRNNNETDTNYAFTASLGENPDQSAVTIAHEAGHALGLGHTQNMQDIMFPSVSPAIGFLTGEAADPGPCNFKMGDIQDGHKVLIDNLGARPASLEKPGVSPPPVVHIISPADGATVGRDVTLAVGAETQAKGGIDHVTLALSPSDGGKFRGGHPVAELRPPQSSAQIRLSVPGNYQLVATAYDQYGNIALTRSTFTVSTITCSAPNDCAPGQKCQSNTCVTPPLPDRPPTAPADSGLRDYGTACDHSSECSGGICAPTPVGQLCTHYCNAERLCAGGLECTDGICLPPIFSRSKPKLGQLGGKCTRKEDCFTGECSPFVDTTTPRYCTRSCEVDVAWSCPSTMVCQPSDTATGMRNICVNSAVGQTSSDSGGGGGCAMSSGSTRRGGGAAGSALVGLVAVLLAGRRRRQRSGQIAG